MKIRKLLFCSLVSLFLCSCIDHGYTAIIEKTEISANPEIITMVRTDTPVPATKEPEPTKIPETATFLPTNHLEQTETPVSTPAVINTKQISYWEDLEDGEYLMFESFSGLMAYSINKISVIKLSDYIAAPSSPDGKIIRVKLETDQDNQLLTLFNLSTDEKIQIETCESCSGYSVNNDMTIIAYEQKEESNFFIRVLFLNDGDVIDVNKESGEKKDDFLSVSFSQDGTTLVFIEMIIGNPTKDLLYMMNTDCLFEKTDRSFSIQGPFDSSLSAVGPHSWSYNSRFFAGFGDTQESIVIFDIQNKTFTKIVEHSEPISSFTWSKSGLGLYYCSPNDHDRYDVYLLDMQTGENKKITELDGMLLGSFIKP